MLQLLLIAARNLATHSRRTLLLGGAIGGVTALLVLMMGLANGVDHTMLESATTLMSGHVNVAGFFKVSSGQSAPVVTHYEKVVDVIRKSTPEVDYVVERGRGWAKLVSDTSSQQAGIGAIDVRNEPGFRKVIEVLSGKLDDLTQPKSILLFEEQAKKLDAKVGDSLTISAQTTRGTNNTVDVRVVAVAKNVGLLSSFNVFVGQDVVRELYQLQPDATGAVMVYLKDMKDVAKVSESLRASLRAAGYQVLEPDSKAFWMKMQGINKEDWTGQRLDVTTWEDEVSFLSWTSTLIKFVSGLLIFILLVVISVGIMNTLWIAIRERTREIGTLRAIGMQRRRVLVMFLFEAILLSLISTAIGAGVGSVIGAWINQAGVHVPEGAQIFLMSDTWHFLVHASSVLKAIGLICVVASVVSLVPSFLAARLKPVTAMSHIG